MLFANPHCVVCEAFGFKTFLNQTNFLRTMFGIEYEVTARTELDSHKAEKNNNHWVLVSGNPSDDEFTHFDR